MEEWTKGIKVPSYVQATCSPGSCACCFCSWAWLFVQSCIISSDRCWTGPSKGYEISIIELNPVQKEVHDLQKARSCLPLSVQETQDQLDGMLRQVKKLKDEKEGLCQRRCQGGLLHSDTILDMIQNMHQCIWQMAKIMKGSKCSC